MSIGIAVLLLTLCPIFGEVTVVSSLPACLYYIAFQGEGDEKAIFRLEQDGVTRTRLSSSDIRVAWPAPSPDGTKIAFIRNYDLYIMDTNGSNVTRITETIWDETSPTWSPDSLQIMFDSDQYGNYELFVYDLLDASFTRITDNSFDDYAPAWSPDGITIAFGSDRDGYSEIHAATLADIGNPVRLTENDNVDYGADWSPDGERLTFYSLRDDNPEPQIYIVNVESGELIQLTDTEYANRAPDWSPDGDLIAYESYRPDGLRINIIDLNTDRVRPLLENGYSPTWCPLEAESR
jgi:TolB protein